MVDCATRLHRLIAPLDSLPEELGLVYTVWTGRHQERSLELVLEALDRKTEKLLDLLLERLTGL